ncbi:MAG: S-layer homology domain-containing protein [Candidatus Margulisiibacteriota bacterium]
MTLLLCGVAHAAVSVANDPTRIGVGARILGMGKAFVGLSDDLTGMFINPAALASVESWQATTMQGKFLNEYNYVNLGSAVPTRFGSFGIGYVGSSISFTTSVATTEIVDGVRIVPSTGEGVSYSFLNSVILLSWGNELKGLLGMSVFDDLSAGATLKVFALELSGPGISNGTASGNEVDVGLNFRPNPVFNAGLVVQNALPFEGGGKIRWKNGTEESFPSVLKVGTSFRIVGKEGFWHFNPHEVSLNVDWDTSPRRPELPSLFHVGLEWQPIELLAIRMGVDQDYAGTGDGTRLEAKSDFTAGVGLTFGRFRFDYAYHQYNSLSVNDTHYFSLSYGVGKEKPVEPAPLFELSPKDKTILFTPEVLVKGTILDKNINKAAVNGREADVIKDDFKISMPLRLRKNLLLVEGFKNKKVIGSEKIRILRLKGFKDVAPDHWASIPISILAMEKMISGYPDKTFKPEGKITRAELCALMVKALSITDSSVTKNFENKVIESITVLSPDSSGVEVFLMSEETLLEDKGIESTAVLFPDSPGVEVFLMSEETLSTFRDLKYGHWARKYILEALEEGIVKGYPDNTFRPNGLVTRAEGVAMISAFAGLTGSKISEVPYSDVPGRHWAIKEIIKARDAGILRYIKGKIFEPNKRLTRTEVAEMISKSPNIYPKVKNILDWKIGY